MKFNIKQNTMEALQGRVELKNDYEYPLAPTSRELPGSKKRSRVG